RSTRENFVQARDRDTGELVWAVEVLDADPESKGTYKVKLSAPVQPVLPQAPAGFPFVPVEFEGLEVTPYVNSGTGRLAYSLKAAAVRPANFNKTGGGAGRSSGKDGGAAAKDAAGWRAGACRCCRCRSTRGRRWSSSRSGRVRRCS